MPAGPGDYYCDPSEARRYPVASEAARRGLMNQSTVQAERELRQQEERVGRYITIFCEVEPSDRRCRHATVIAGSRQNGAWGLVTCSRDVEDHRQETTLGFDLPVATGFHVESSGASCGCGFVGRRMDGHSAVAIPPGFHCRILYARPSQRTTRAVCTISLATTHDLGHWPVLTELRWVPHENQR